MSIWRSFQQCYELMTGLSFDGIVQFGNFTVHSLDKVSQNNGHWSFRKCFADFTLYKSCSLKLGPFLAGDKNLFE